MTIPKLSFVAIFVTAFGATGLGAAGAPARADVITLDVAATFSPLPGSPTACSPTCTLGGDIVINNSAGAANRGFVSADVTATGFLPSVGPFTTLIALVRVVPPAPNTLLELEDSATDALQLFFDAPTPGGSFAGYTGGQLSPSSVILSATSGGNWHLSSGSLTPATVPEPPSLLLLLSALAGFGGVLLSARVGGTAPPRVVP